jgi:hypothetical protein
VSDEQEKDLQSRVQARSDSSAGFGQEAKKVGKAVDQAAKKGAKAVKEGGKEFARAVKAESSQDSKSN